ncbi:hypothetical protein KQ874_02425 [Mycoplasma sp. ES3157-GEN-MYC]|uniref:MSC_0620 family F1-like ATPase-associated subunit n=1 Tax=Mycoplasma miroungigenitalium TaxID=754515 RepID=UPI001C1100A4|nr:hypothetical protein [Mycoplasma miroungigenitalium]MBU4690540.1 hypothetical protein [Mycoplasma miroungigenitalium]MBU4691807.1 hypothetical protein [Mycoplasma miroungigenitalium]
MNKKRRLLFSLGSITSLTIPLTVISANTKEKNQTHDAPDAPEIPKTPDPDFFTFKELGNKQINESIEKSIEIVTSFLKDELAKVKIDTKSDYKSILSKTIYLNKIIAFFENNKNTIIKNPDSFGLYITFPNAIAREAKLGNGIVEFNGKQYENIVFGLGDDKQSKYDRIIETQKIKKSSENQNLVQKSEFIKTIKKYSEAMMSEIKGIIFDKNDLLLVDKDYSLKYTKIGENNEESGLVITNPKGFKNWDDYFIKKITTRFVEFDLKQNQEFIQNEKKTPKSPETPPQLPPLVPNKPPLPTNPTITETTIEALPILAPLLKSEFVGYSYENLNAAINSGKDVFFFNNPINTRYIYKVQSITNEYAKVSIFERSKPELKRIYNIKFNLQLNKDRFKQKILFEQIKSIEKTVLKFYKAVGLDENLNYNQIRNTALQSMVFGMVDQFIKLISSSDFLISFDKSSEYWTSKMQNIDDFRPISGAKHDIIRIFLNAVASSTYNGEHNFSAIAQIYDSFLENDYSEYFKNNKEIINQNFKLMNLTYKQKTKIKTNYDINVVDEFIDVIAKNVYKVKSLSTPVAFNIEKWYNKFTSNLTTLNTQFEQLSVLSNNKLVDDESYLNYHEAYTNALSYIKIQKSKINEFEKNFGITLTAIGGIILILNIILIATNLKTLRQRKLRTLYIALILVGLIIVVIGASLIFLGMKGI